MNYANRTWYGAYDTKDQTGSVVGYLGEFLKKHPEIIANRDAFYKEGGYLNGMYFNNDCIESLENPKNGFFVPLDKLSPEQRKAVVQDLAELFENGSSEALLVCDTIVAGMDPFQSYRYLGPKRKPSEQNQGLTTLIITEHLIAFSMMYVDVME